MPENIKPKDKKSEGKNIAFTEKTALAALKEREARLDKKYKRMKVDEDLARKAPFSLTDSQGNKIPNCDHVTLPKAAIFANRANSITAAANQQIMITGEGLDDKYTTKAENFYRIVFSLGDQLLRKRNRIKAFLFHSNMINLRGTIGQRIDVEIDEEGKLQVDLLPMDYRFAAFDYDNDGMAWHSYRSNRSKNAIERSYPSTKVSGQIGKVIEFISRDTTFIFVDEKLVEELPNEHGYVNVAMAQSPAGLFFQNDDLEENSAESIFWLDRDLYKEANRIASVLATLNSGSLFPPLQKEYEEIPNEQPASPLGGTRTVVPVRVGEKFSAMPRADVYNATRMEWSIIDALIQQGSFSTIEFGTLQFPLSAVALEGLAEGRELVLAPSLQGLAEMYLSSCEMIKKQFVELGQTVELKGIGEKAKYSAKDIEADYDITFSYFTGSRKYALAGIAEARDIGNLVSDDYKRRHLIKVENPDGEAAKLDAQQAEEMHPEQKVYRQIIGFMDEGKWAQAWMHRLKLRKILMAEYAPEKPIPDMASQVGGGVNLFSGAPSRTTPSQDETVVDQETRKAEREVEKIG